MGRFKKLDRDGDKTLSRKEIKKGLKVLEQGTRRGLWTQPS
jgi:hypothetical protein